MASNSLLEQDNSELFPGMTSDSNFSFEGALGQMNDINLSSANEDTNTFIGCDGMVIKLEPLPELYLDSPITSVSTESTEPPQSLHYATASGLSGVSPAIVPFFGFPFGNPVCKETSPQISVLEEVVEDPSTNAEPLETPQFDISILPLDLDDSIASGKAKDSSSFHCLFCLASFDSNHKLCWHQNSCTNNPFLIQDIATSPPDSMTSQSSFKCATCYKAFKSNTDLLSHSCTAKRYTCEVCGKSYSNICVKVRHMHSHSNVRPHECSVCHKTFIRKEYLTSHLRIHTGDRPYSCHICGKKFAYSSAKRSHVKLHRTKPYICSVCNKNFVSSEKLKTIPVPGTSDVLFSCEKCCKAPDSPIPENFPQEESPIPINVVSEQDIEHSVPRLDEKRENAVRNLKCDYCPRMYIRRSDLTKHLRTHVTKTAPTPAKCTQIQGLPPDVVIGTSIGITELIPNTATRLPESASQLENTQSSTATETDEFTCRLCNRSFARKKLLLCHIYAHLGIKPFSCSVCEDKKYSRKEDLVLHMRTHTGERPFQCNLCDKKFIRRRSYRLHRQTHINESGSSSLLADNVGLAGDPQN